MQTSSKCGMPSLRDPVSKAGPDKIRRPPNAFMLFAREHRATVAKQHPDVTNKVISTILGRIWKSTPCNIKEKYFEKAKVIGALHKSKYPDYVYSPREARLRKMKRMKKKDAIICDLQEPSATRVIFSPQEIHSEETPKVTDHRDTPNDEDRITDTGHHLKSSPEYVPNNPEYYVPSSPELHIADSEDTEMHSEGLSQSTPHLIKEQNFDNSDVDQEKAYPQVNRNIRSGCIPCAGSEICPEEGACYSRNNLESSVRHSRPYGIPDTDSSYFPERHRYSCSSSHPASCNASGHLPGFMNSCCWGSQHYGAQVPRNHGSPFWNHPVSNHRKPYFQGRDYTYDDMQLFPHPRPYHPAEFYAPFFSYFDKSIPPHYRGPGLNFYPWLSENWENGRRFNEELGSEGLERHPWVNYFNKNENAPFLYPRISRSEDEVCDRNKTERFDSVNTEHVSCTDNFATKSETLNSPCASSCCNGARFLDTAEKPCGWKNQSHTCSSVVEGKQTPTMSSFQYNQYPNKSFLDNNVSETHPPNSSSENQRSPQHERVCDSDFVSLPITDSTRNTDKIDSSEHSLNTSLVTVENGASLEIVDATLSQPFSLLKSETSIPCFVNEGESNHFLKNNHILKLEGKALQLTNNNSQNNIEVEYMQDWPQNKIDSTNKSQITLQEKYNLNLEHEFVYYSQKSNKESFVKEHQTNFQNTESKNMYDETPPVTSYNPGMITLKSESVSPNSFSVRELPQNSCEIERSAGHNLKDLDNTKIESGKISTSSLICCANSNSANEDSGNLFHGPNSFYRKSAENVEDINAVNNSMFLSNDNNNLRYLRQRNFAEVYFRQSDGSTAIQDKLPAFSTLVSKVHNFKEVREKLVLNNSTDNSMRVISSAIKTEKMENCDK